MRTYGRVRNDDGTLSWVEVNTDRDGYNDFVMLTTLAQVLQLIRGESPFFANYGIPAQQAVVQQVFPDFYVAQTQQQFAVYFASLVVTKLGGTTPHYTVNVVTQQGVSILEYVPIPQ